MDRLQSTVQSYRWGSRTFIAEMQGRHPTGEPEAELWLGAHPSAPSRVDRGGGPRPLHEVIAEDPRAELGTEVAERWGRLPFLLKVLAAAEPLSLQAHPDEHQAIAGWEREEAAGLPVDSPVRSFRDRSHKPELLCALTPFEALCGFRQPAEAHLLLAELDAPALRPVVELLAQGGPRVMALATERLLRAPTDEATRMVGAAAESCHRLRGGPHDREAAWVTRLAADHPADAGVVLTLLLNLVSLDPGEAVFLGSGTLHAYLCGAGIEVMASSDNVLRGGLTPKHVDVEALVGILDPRPSRPEVQRCTGTRHRYQVPAPEFGLVRMAFGGETAAVEVVGPEIVLVTEGSIRACHPGGELELRAGEAAFVPASDGRYELAGRGVVFRATVGEPRAA